MGYYRNGGGSVALKEGVTHEEILASLQKTMFEPEYFAKVARGGSFPKGEGDSVFSNTWYSWTDTALLMSTTSLEEFIGQFFEELEFSTDGRAFNFSDSNKIGQEDILFEHLAPFLQSEEEFARWTGEDDTHWAWSIRRGKLVELSGHIIYEG
jgi:hypothetical protein